MLLGDLAVSRLGGGRDEPHRANVAGGPEHLPQQRRPQLDNTGLNETFVAYARAAGAGANDLRRLAVEPIDHLWIDDTQRRELRAQFDRESAAIELSLEGANRWPTPPEPTEPTAPTAL